MTACRGQEYYTLALQVSMAGGGSKKGFDMQNCWVNLLSAKIPVLVMAVDDPLLTCADRVLHHWKKPGASASLNLHTNCPQPVIHKAFTIILR